MSKRKTALLCAAPLFALAIALAVTFATAGKGIEQPVAAQEHKMWVGLGRTHGIDVYCDPEHHNVVYVATGSASYGQIVTAMTAVHDSVACK